MSFLSKLQIDGQEYNVLNFIIDFKQGTDTTGKPSGVPHGGRIKLTIEATQDSGFLSWMLDAGQVKDGTITFYRRDAMSKMRELSFTKAYCIAYEEQFTYTTESPMQIRIELTARELTFGDARFSNHWVSLD